MAKRLRSPLVRCKTDELDHFAKFGQILYTIKSEVYKKMGSLAHLHRSLEFFHAISNSVGLVDYLKNGIAHRGFM